jgi:ketosteroid isomerase-like protein
MRAHYLKWLIIVALLPVYVVGASSSSSSEITAQVTELAEQARVAALKGDADWQERNLAEDFTAIEPTGEIKTKSEAIAMRRSGAVKFESIVILDRQVRVYGDTAIVITRANIKAHISGHEIEGGSWLTAVWVKRNGQWKEVASQSTSIPKK